MKRVLALCLTLLLLTGCGAPKKADKTVYAMDTVMTLTAYGEEALTAEALEEGEWQLRRLDALLSTTLESSDIYRVNRDSTAIVSRETGLLLQRALEIAAMTEGDFDPTVYPLMRTWGFAPVNGEYNYRVPWPVEAKLTLSRVGYEKLYLQEITAGENAGKFRVTLPPMQLSGIDLGGIAKGFAAEQVLAAMGAEGVESAIISLGGNVGALGLKPDGSPWTVAIRDPSGSESDYMATLSLGQPEACVYAVTSGGYERYFEENGKRYHHILDPKTGYPADSDLLSVTIVSQDGTLADGLSTALFVMGFDGAVEFWRTHMDAFDAAFDMVLYDGETLYVTPGLELETDLPVKEVTP